MGGMVIFVTGRTVGDIEGELKRKGKNVPEIIAGDNGAVIYSTKTREFLTKKTLDHETVLKMVDNYLENGGNKDYIRFTNGEEVFASKQKEVEKYYEGNKKVKLLDDIYQTIEQTQDITKVTLAEKEEIIRQSERFIKEQNCWTDKDVTKFPRKDCENYRLDVAQNNISKGDAVMWLTEKLSPEYGFICIGNGANDISMFKVAIDNNMTVAMMPQTSPEVLEEIEQYVKERKRGKVEVIPRDRHLANKYILKKAKMFEEHVAKKEKEIGKKQRLPNIPRVKVPGLSTKNISRGTGLQTKGRDR